MLAVVVAAAGRGGPATPRDNAQRLAQYLNGDTRSRISEHCEVGCCLGGRFDHVIIHKNVHGAIGESGLCSGGSGQLVSKQRVGSMAESLSAQTVGEMMHGVLPSCCLDDIQKWEDGYAGRSLAMTHAEWHMHMC